MQKALHVVCCFIPESFLDPRFLVYFQFNRVLLCKIHWKMSSPWCPSEKFSFFVDGQVPVFVDKIAVANAKIDNAVYID